MDKNDLVAVSVVGLAPAQQAGGFVVFLKEDGSSRCLPIVVGGAEAQAISIILSPLALGRPMTHDTFKNIIDALRGEIKRVVITKLHNSTFHADIWLTNAMGDTFHLDARPSDAIAIALKNGAPICVVREVMDEAGIELPTNPSGGQEAPGATAPQTDLQALQARLQKALEEENYEDAARLRDQIRRLSKDKDAPGEKT